MSAPESVSESILPSVAKHEKQLLAQIQASEKESREIIEQARDDARKHLASEESKLIEEVARIRREAESHRARAFRAAVDAAEQQLAGVREEARLRVQATGKNVLALFLPSTPGGTGA